MSALVGCSSSPAAMAQFSQCSLFASDNLSGLLWCSKKPSQLIRNSFHSKVIASFPEKVEHHLQESDKKLTRRENILRLLLGTALPGVLVDQAEAVSTSRRALKGEKVPESDYKTLPNGLKYYDLKVGGGAIASKGSRVAVHYVVKWKGVTFMTSRQGLGVTGGTPYGFDVGSSEQRIVLKGLDYGVQGMRVGGQRLLIVPPQLAYGNKGIQEIPPNATLEMNVELLSIKQSPFGSPVKIVEG